MLPLPSDTGRAVLISRRDVRGTASRDDVVALRRLSSGLLRHGSVFAATSVSELDIVPRLVCLLDEVVPLGLTGLLVAYADNFPDTGRARLDE